MHTFLLLFSLGRRRMQSPLPCLTTTSKTRNSQINLHKISNRYNNDNNTWGPSIGHPKTPQPKPPSTPTYNRFCFLLIIGTRTPKNLTKKSFSKVELNPLFWLLLWGYPPRKDKIITEFLNRSHNNMLG